MLKPANLSDKFFQKIFSEFFFFFVELTVRFCGFLIFFNHTEDKVQFSAKLGRKKFFVQK